LNPLSREREFPSELAQLVTIGRQNRKIFDCFALRCGSRDRVNFEGRGHLRVTQLRLRLSERGSRVLQKLRGDWVGTIFRRVREQPRAMQRCCPVPQPVLSPFPRESKRAFGRTVRRTE